jgi:hypothetical protein
MTAWLHTCRYCPDGFARWQDLRTHEESCRGLARPSRRPNAKERRRKLRADDLAHLIEGAPDR